MPRRKAVIRSDVESGWKGVRLNQKRVAVNTGMDALFHSVEFRDLCHSLVLVHAFGVLQEALQNLAAEGRVPCKSSKLGPLMTASKKCLTWDSYPKILQGKRRRDEIAHKARYLPQTESREYIQAIEVNLKAWGFKVSN